jgi:hypothetical protein
MNKSITVTYVYDNLVILTNTEIDESIQLDESGSMVWKLIEKGMTKEEIIKKFQLLYPMQAEEIYEDITELYTLLTDKGYI